MRPASRSSSRRHPRLPFSWVSFRIEPNPAQGNTEKHTTYLFSVSIVFAPNRSWKDFLVHMQMFASSLCESYIILPSTPVVSTYWTFSSDVLLPPTGLRWVSPPPPHACPFRLTQSRPRTSSALHFSIYKMGIVADPAWRDRWARIVRLSTGDVL